MTQHLHAEFVPGCYRCDLSRDELAFMETCEHEWMVFGGFDGSEWRECFLCGKQEES